MSSAFPKIFLQSGVEIVFREAGVVQHQLNRISPATARHSRALKATGVQLPRGLSCHPRGPVESVEHPVECFFPVFGCWFLEFFGVAQRGFFDFLKNKPGSYKGPDAFWKPLRSFKYFKTDGEHLPTVYEATKKAKRPTRGAFSRSRPGFLLRKLLRTAATVDRL